MLVILNELATAADRLTHAVHALESHVPMLITIANFNVSVHLLRVPHRLSKCATFLHTIPHIKIYYIILIFD